MGGRSCLRQQNYTDYFNYAIGISSLSVLSVAPIKLDGIAR